MRLLFVRLVPLGSALQAASARIGLELVADKCQAFGMPSDDGLSAAAVAVAQQLNIKHAAEGLVAAGTPVGTEAFIRSHVRQKVSEVMELVDRLCALPDPLTKQDKFVILTQSLQHKVSHLPRTIPWRLLKDDFAALSIHLCKVALSLFNMPLAPTDQPDDTRYLHH